MRAKAHYWQRTYYVRLVFSSEEIDKISQVIYNHTDKANMGTLFDEILKDADVLQHCFYNPLAPVAKHEKDRFRMLKEELGLDIML